MYNDKFDCVYEKCEKEKVDVKEEENSKTENDVLESVDDQSANNESQSTKSVIKTEKQNKSNVATWPDLSRFTNITIYDLKLHLSLLKEYSAKKNANETNETVKVKEKHETDSDSTEINEDDHSAVSESQSTKSVIKTERQNKSNVATWPDLSRFTNITIYDLKLHLSLLKEYSAKKNANETNETVKVKEKHETDSDATEINEDDHSAVSEFQQNTEPLVSRSLSSCEKQTKNHKCPHCDKSFSIATALKRHQLVHNGIKAYKCPICSKAVGQKSTLKTHQLVHTGIQAHKCTICTKSFSLKSHLTRHQLVHNDVKAHQCPTCSKLFKEKGDLKKHQLLHTGIKAHKCTVCSKSFTQKGNLTSHQAVHNDTLPFQCSTCEKTFKCKSYLRKHLRKMHQQ